VNHAKDDNEEEDDAPQPKRSKPTIEEIEYDAMVREAISKFTQDEQQGELYHKDFFKEPYLRPPCHICGMDDHGVLRKRGIRGDDLGEVYDCPFATHEDWNEVKNRSSDERFEICPTKVAEKSGYDMEAADVILSKHREVGEGRNRAPEVILSIRDEVERLCNEFVRNLPFKREIKPSAAHEDDDDESENS